MSLTADYSRLHGAFVDAGRALNVEPMVARVALAVLDRGRVATSHEIEADLLCQGSAVRRALGQMYRHGLAHGSAPDGSRRRPGQVTHVRLTEEGLRLAALVRVTYAALREQAA